MSIHRRFHITFTPFDYLLLVEGCENRVYWGWWFVLLEGFFSLWGHGLIAVEGAHGDVVNWHWDTLDGL